MSQWLTIQTERALYVDQGRETILCDRLPPAATLVVCLSSESTDELRQALRSNTEEQRND